MEINHYQSVLKSAPFGYAYHQVITDSGGDGYALVFLDVNPVFEKITGLKGARITGKNVREVLTDKKPGHSWIELYDKIGHKETTEEFEHYDDSTGRSYRVQVQFPEDGFMVILLNDLTKVISFENHANRQRSGIALLATDKSIVSGDLDRGLERIAEVLSEVLSVERTSIWRLSADRRELKCLTLYETGKRSHGSGLSLGTDLFPSYFNAIKSELRINAFDAQIDPRTAELSRSYLKPLEITSMLDAGILIEGDLVGVVCCEHRGPKRKWRSDEESFLNTIAAIIAQLFVNTERRKAEAALEESEAKLRRITDNISDVVFTTDMDLNITYASPSVEKLVGEPLESYISKGLEEKYTSESLLKIKSLFEKELEREKDPASDKSRSRITELEFIKADGSIIYLSAHLSFIRDDKGKSIGLQGVARDITDRVEINKALQESEISYRNIFGYASDAIYVQDELGFFIDVNPAATRMYGYTREEMIGYTPDKLAAPGLNDMKRTKEHLRKAFKGESQRFEWWGKRKNGEIFLKDIVLNKGTYFGREVVFAMARDITGQYNILKALEESEDKYRSLTNQLPVGVYRTTIDGRFVYSNPALAKILGYDSVEELLGLNVRQLYLNPSERDRQLNFSAKNNEDIQCEVRLIKKNGELIWARDNSRLIFDSKEQPQYFDGVLEDITAQKLADEALLESESKLRATLKANPDLMFRIDRKGTFIDFHYNKGMDLFVGPSLIKGSNVKDHFSKELAGKILSSIGECLDTGVMKSIEYSLLISGKKKFFEARHVPVDKDEVLTFARDISEQKRKEKELVIAKEKAEESDRLKSVFLANVSHEIRTPMNAILGFLELMKNPGLQGEEISSYIDIVNQSGQRLLSTINDIIEISKIESGQSEVVYSQVNTQELMRFHYDLFRQEAHEKGILLKLAKQIRGDKVFIQSDIHKLEGILTNLINNAIKFTRSGVIEFGNYLKENSLLFYVKDTGRGIPPDRHKAIFNRFVQSDLNNTRTHEGSGLGLSIAKAYVEMLGGNIWVKSKTGKGSTFFFSIPFIPVKVTKSKTDKVDETAGVLRRKVKLLIAEDDELSFKFLESILNEEGIIIIHAVNGEEAVKCLNENPDISLIIMDIKMPVLDGLEATRHIRTFNKTIPIIAQTAYALAGDRERALEAGCNHYISKPVNRKELLRIFNKCIGK